MKCKKCGAEIEAGDIFCGSCGEKVDAENTSSDEVSKYDEAETAEKKPKKKTKLIIGIVIAAVVVIAELPYLHRSLRKWI